jgi:hypothetical protein
MVVNALNQINVVMIQMLKLLNAQILALEALVKVLNFHLAKWPANSEDVNARKDL